MKLDALARLRGVPPSRSRWHRMVDSRFADQLDETAQTVLRAWRWNPRGEFAVLYLASSPDCCRAEKLRHVGGDESALPPQILGEFNVHLSRCLDLTDDKVLSALGATRAELLRPEDFSIPQSVSRAARHRGFEALITPSAAGDDCVNLVVFKDRLSPPSSCSLISTKHSHH